MNNDDIKRAMIWVWKNSDLQPFDAVSEMAGNIVVRRIWHCHGCKGEFVSKEFVPYVGYGDDPTDETFPHEAGCTYLLAKRIVEEMTSLNGHSLSTG